MRSIRSYRILCGIFAALLVCSPAATAAPFTLGATIRAGLRGAGDWELGLGAASPFAAATSHAAPYFDDNEEYNFTLSYDSAANQARLSVATNPGNGPDDVVIWNPTGGTPNTASRLWTIAGNGGLAVSAAYAVRPAGQPPMPRTEIEVKDLALGPGIDILSGLSVTDLRARQEGASATDAVPQAVVFTTRDGSGDWLLSGTIRMRGLRSEFPSGAVRSELQFLFSATASDFVPEPSASSMLLLAAAGGAFLARTTTRKR